MLGNTSNRRIKTDIYWLLLIIVLDQITKYAALHYLPEYTRVAAFPGLNFTLTWNTGVSFGMFQGMAYGQYILSALAIAICTYLFRWMWTTEHRGERLALATIIGGALGNVIDRFVHGAVVDFIDVYYRTSHWPAFNIADSAITCGVIALVLYPLLFQRKEKNDDA